MADRVVSFNGTPVRTTCDLVADVHPLSPGAAVTLGVDKAHISTKGVITWGRESTIKLRTAKSPSALGVLAVRRCQRFEFLVARGLPRGLGYLHVSRASLDRHQRHRRAVGGSRHDPVHHRSTVAPLVDRRCEDRRDGHDRTSTGTSATWAASPRRPSRSSAPVRSTSSFPKSRSPPHGANASPGLTIIGVTTLHQALQALTRIGGAKPVPLTAPRSHS